MTILETIRDKALSMWDQQGILDESISVTAAPLTAKEAIGTPQETDFPIQKGKEKLMEAVFRGARGQAFTDHYGCFAGSLAEVGALPLTNNFVRAIFVSTLNAVCRAQDLACGTVHCRDTGPRECSEKIFDHISRHYDARRVTVIGFQPALAEALAKRTDIRLVDLDPDNVGQTKRGVLVEGEEATRDAVDWCDLMLVTGTTLANDTISQFLTDKPVLFYGTTISGAAAIMGWDRFCPMSS